jgi:hypothetical protein
VLAKREAERLGCLVADDCIGDLDFIVCEVDLELVPEPARNISFDADPGTPDFVAKAKASSVSNSVRALDVGEIILKTPERLDG